MIRFIRSAVLKKTVLFVCVENAARGQMAEGFFRMQCPEGYQVSSAGTRPVAEINPLAIQVMGELGIDIAHQRSKDLTEDLIRNSNLIVNMGCVEKEACPSLYLNNVIEWNIEDPKQKSVEQVRQIRNEIERRVKELVASLKANLEINI